VVVDFVLESANAGGHLVDLGSRRLRGVGIVSRETRPFQPPLLLLGSRGAAVDELVPNNAQVVTPACATVHKLFGSSTFQRCCCPTLCLEGL
jgi:hypothetical protein